MTATAAIGGLVQRQNQLLVDGQVIAVRGDGTLGVIAQGVAIDCRAVVVDHLFSVGQSVLLARADDGQWVVLGPGGPVAATGGIPAVGVPPPSSNLAAQSLHAAMLRLVAKQNQVLQAGVLLAVYGDGSLSIQTRTGVHVAFAASDQVFAPGQSIYALRKDSGEYLVVGSVRS